MNSCRTLLLTVFFAVFAVTTFAQNETPMAAAKSFYAFHKTHDSSFTRATVDARKGWFSNALYNLFLRELQREKAFLKKHPNDKPYFGEGLPFQPWDETCTVGKKKLHKQLSFRPDAEDTNIATVRVTFAFPSPCKTPDANVYTLQMVRSTRGWVIDNLIYDAGTDLVTDLNRKEY
jgi:hypothetical protein